MTNSIEFAGKSYQFEIGLAFLGEVLEVFECDIAGLGQKLGRNPYKYLPVAIHVSNQVSSELNGHPVQIESIQEAVKIIEEDGGMMSPGGVEWLNYFDKYMTKGLPKPEEDKKKVAQDKPKAQKKEKKKS